MKSVFWLISEGQKTAVLTIFEALNFDFGKISHLKMSKVPKNVKFRAAEMVKMAVFGALKLQKLNSRKNLSGRKF